MIRTMKHLNILILVPDPELAEHDGKVHVVKMNNIGLADAALFKVSIKLTCCCSGLKFLQTEDSKKKIELCREDDISLSRQWPGHRECSGWV